MKKIASYAVAGLLAAGAAIGSTAPARAEVSFSIGLGGPLYYGYDYYRPCRWYFEHEFPAPRRCYRDFYDYYGPDVYISDGFVFRSRAYWDRWRYRDDFRRWRSYDWERHRRDWERDRIRDRWEDRRDRWEDRHDRMERRHDRWEARHDRWERHHDRDRDQDNHDRDRDNHDRDRDNHDRNRDRHHHHDH